MMWITGGAGFLGCPVADDQPAPAARIDARGVVSDRAPLVLVTGGAGFIGSNLCLALLELGCRVRALDDLSRRGAPSNGRALEERGGKRFELQLGDVRHPSDVEHAARDVHAVFHLAAQVGVSSSFADPRTDFGVNALGTLNVLEALRRRGDGAPLLHASTHAVYGDQDSMPVRREGRRYVPRDAALASRGIGERALDCRTPFGCSKGAAEQYVLDYAHCFGLPAAVFRMSCIYGPRQREGEDQDSAAYFLTRMLADETMTISGDGYQVRDLLFVDDLVTAFLEFLAAPERLAGLAFNVGGGPRNSLSLLELLELEGEIAGRSPLLAFERWRPGVPRWYVSDTSRLEAATGWKPRVGVREGLERSYRWMVDDAQHRGHAMRPASAREARARALRPR